MTKFLVSVTFEVEAENEDDVYASADAWVSFLEDAPVPGGTFEGVTVRSAQR